MSRRWILTAAVAASLLAAAPASSSHPPIYVEFVQPVADQYVVVGVYDPFTNVEVLGNWALACLGYGDDCSFPPPAGGDRVEVWRETNGVPWLQRTTTCPDGSTYTGTCPFGGPIPPDTLEQSIR